MFRLDRRTFLRATVASALLPLSAWSGACVDNTELQPPLPEYEYEGPAGPSDLFSHGVASGDPLPDAVVIWTRISTEPEGAPDEVWWEVARDASFRDRVAVGQARTSADSDWTVKVDVTGLSSGTTYYYRFRAFDLISPVGRTRTASRSDTTHVRLGIVSCSNIARGYFHAYRALAGEDIDAVLHLGDYFYESGSASEIEGRSPLPPRELISLEDYRTRYAFYRQEADLQNLHRQHAFIPIWDDHESANDAYADGASAHQADEGDWALRKAAAQRAWFEWMPVRNDEERRIWRALRFGNLVDLYMLDTRLWGRDPQVLGENAVLEERTILGFDQEAWLFEELERSEATWRVIGQQVMMAQLKSVGLPESDGGGSYINLDQWDGYRASRDRLYDVIETNDVDNLVVLTGDIHTSWANDLTRDPNDPGVYDPDTGRGALGAEFVCPGVTSGGFPDLPDRVLDRLLGENPHVKYSNLTQRGFIVLDITPERVQSDFFHIADIEVPETEISHSASFALFDRTEGIREINEGPAAARATPPELAP